MRMIRSKFMVLITALLILFGSGFAHHSRTYPEGMGKHPSHGKAGTRHMPMIPDSTEKQEEKIKKLRAEHLKVLLPLQNELAEKEAQLHTLSTAEKVDMKKIYRMIEEIGAIKIQMMKERATHHQDIRKLLTEKQRLVFDMHPHHRGRRHSTHCAGPL